MRCGISSDDCSASDGVSRKGHKSSCGLSFPSTKMDCSFNYLRINFAKRIANRKDVNVRVANESIHIDDCD